MEGRRRPPHAGRAGRLVPRDGPALGGYIGIERAAGGLAERGQRAEVGLRAGARTLAGVPLRVVPAGAGILDGGRVGLGGHVTHGRPGPDPYPPWRVSARNSSRVRASVRRSPRRALVTVREPRARTPRRLMHRCSASTTTPTPRASR